MRGAVRLAATLTCIFVGAGADLAIASDGSSPTITANGNQQTDDFTVAVVDGSDTPDRAGSASPSDRYLRIDTTFCSVVDTDIAKWTVAQTGGCAEGQIERGNTEPCPPGTVETGDLWVERVRPDGTYGNPEFVSEGTCVTPPGLAAEVERAFATMHVPAPPATLQTGDPTTLLVNAWYPVYTSNTPVTQQTVLLDVPVEIRATPAQFTWDFDDPFSSTGSTLTTTDPGRPWHDGDATPDEHWVAHAWTRLGDPSNAHDRAQGTSFDEDADAKYRTDVTVTLTTTWHGQYRITGTPTWTDIPGQLTTTSTAGTYTVTEAPTKLYCDDLTGHSSCRD